MVGRMLVRTAVLFFLVGLCASIRMLAAEPEWLSLCGQCLNPSVVARSGIGTDKAAVEAKVTRDDAARWCNNVQPGPNVETCIQGQLANDSAKKLYRATADCTLGRLTGIDGKPYTLAGQWTAGEGKGRTTWRNAAGTVVGQDNASGGLAISQQWEILCPGPIQASARAAAQQAGRGAAAPAVAQPAAPAPPPVCGGKAYCTEVASFAATIADFTTSVTGDYRYLTATVRFQNKTNGPLFLGYQDGSGIAVDDQGNRYGIERDAVRGIGLITNTALDAKFRLDPGESRDARIEFNWKSSGREIRGTTYKADLTIREIIPTASAGQYRPGREYPLSFNKLGTQTASLPSAEAPAAPMPAPAARIVIPNACAGIQRCFSSGPLSAEVTQVIASVNGNAASDHELVVIRLKVRNISDQPLVLAYVSRSASAIDDAGNRFGTDYTGSGVEGIPALGGTSGVSSNFTLKPGETRNVTFGLIFARARNNVMGTSYNFTATLGQLEVLPGKQLRSAGEYVVSFPGLVASAGKPSVVGACAGIQRCDDAGPFTMDITQISAAPSPNGAKAQTVQMTVRFRNVSGQTITLTHAENTSLMIDNDGNQYAPLGEAAKGIPVYRNFGPVDAGFSLKPGETRTATFQVVRRTPPVTAIGKSFSWFVTIEQWDTLQSQVVSAGQYALAFPGLTASGPSLLNILRQAVPTK